MSADMGPTGYEVLKKNVAKRSVTNPKGLLQTQNSSSCSSRVSDEEQNEDILINALRMETAVEPYPALKD